MKEKSHKDLRKLYKSLFVVVLSITLCSLDVNISVVCTTASDKRLERRYLWKTRTYHLQRVHFVASQPIMQHCLEQWSNAKLDEGVKRFFV